METVWLARVLGSAWPSPVLLLPPFNLLFFLPYNQERSPHTAGYYINQQIRTASFCISHFYNRVVLAAITFAPWSAKPWGDTGGLCQSCRVITSVNEMDLNTRTLRKRTERERHGGKPGGRSTSWMKQRKYFPGKTLPNESHPDLLQSIHRGLTPVFTRVCLRHIG